MLLIDADSLVYKAGWSVEERVYTLQHPDGSSQEFKTKKAAKLADHTDSGEIYYSSRPADNPGFAINSMNKLLGGILDDLPRREYVCVLSGPGDRNFRHSIAKTKPYKGNRSEEGKPYYYDLLREHIMQEFCGVIAPDGLEADDYLGIHQTDSTVICGIDKDLLQIPGRHHNYDKKIDKYVSETEGWFNFFAQVLTGDASDNIPGLPRVGPARAYSILSTTVTPKEMYDVVKQAYEDYQVADRFSEVCSLLYLLRDHDDSWSKQETWFEEELKDV